MPGLFSAPPADKRCNYEMLGEVIFMFRFYSKFPVYLLLYWSIIVSFRIK